MQSEPFTTIAELNKHYDSIRKNILERHGFKEGDKVRLKNAIMMYQNFNGQWIKRTSVKSDMREHVKLNNILDDKKEFMLKAIV